MNKRGLSEIVTTVLIILLVIAAIVIIWMLARSFIFGTTSQVESGLFTTSLTIKKNSIYYNISEGNTSFIVERKAGQGELAGVAVILDGDKGDSCVIKVPGILKELESKRIGPISYASCNVGNLTKISIAPIVLNKDGKELQGEVSDRYVISGNTANLGNQNGGPVNCIDNDGDYYNITGGSCGVIDCNDNNVNINPGKTETCGNGIDEDCNPVNDICPVDLTTGLVGYWSFDNQSNVGKDYSVSNKPGNNIGASFVSCEGNKGALSFNGLNNYVEIADSIEFDNENMTISVWFKSDATSNNGGLISKFSSWIPWGGWEVYFSRHNTPTERLTSSYWENNDPQGGSSSTNTYLDGSWHHAAVSINGTNMTLYIDGGAEIISRTINLKIADSPWPVKIGYAEDGSYFGGIIDEVRVYNRVLSQNEINALAQTSQRCEIDPLKNLFDTNRINYWKFDGNANDEYGNVNLGVYNLVSWVDGKVDSGAKIDESASMICVNQNAGLYSSSLTNELRNLPQNSYSISWWDYVPSNNGGTRTHLASDVYIDGCGYCSFWNERNYTWNRRLENPNDDSMDLRYTTPPINQWNHFVYYFDYPNRESGMYVNGVLVDEKTLLDGNYGNMQWISVGVYSPNCVDAYPEAIFDELMIFNKALSSQEVNLLYDSYN